MHCSTTLNLSIYHVILMKRGIPESPGLEQGGTKHSPLAWLIDTGFPIVHWNLLGFCWVSVTLLWLARNAGAPFTQHDIQFVTLPAGFSSRLLMLVLGSHSNPSDLQGLSKCTYTKKEILCDWKSLENLVPDCQDFQSTPITAPHGQTICNMCVCRNDAVYTSCDWWRSMQLIRAI
jgi:hypothetical protein